MIYTKQTPINQIMDSAIKACENKMKIGSRVTRKYRKSHDYYNGNQGTVIDLIPFRNSHNNCVETRAYIKWDDISKTTYTYYYKDKKYTKTTNQQHSTVNLKALDLI